MDINLLLPALQIAKEAGEKILAVYQRTEAVTVQVKDDESPLTEADLAAHHHIVAGLSALTPSFPVLSEESTAVAFAERASWQNYWLVDPLDGTKEFIQKTDEFTINIALIVKHQAALGIVYAPALDLCYFAMQEYGAYKQEGAGLPQLIHTRTVPTQGATVVASRRHGLGQLQSFLAQLGDHAIVQRGSALKCCLVADGSADIYPRFGLTSEWDTAAGQCVLEQAGGKLIDCAGNPLVYNTKESLLNPSFLAVGDVNYNWQSYLEKTQ